MANTVNYRRTSYRVRQFTQNSIGTGGSITFHGGTSALATGTGTMITATNTHDYWFSNLRVPGQIFSSVATGTAPFTVASTTLVSNLNSDLWDGYQFSDYLNQSVRTTDSPTFTGLTSSGGINRLGAQATYRVYVDGGIMIRDYANNTLTNGRMYFQDDAFYFRGGGEAEADATTNTNLYVRNGGA